MYSVCLVQWKNWTTSFKEVILLLILLGGRNHCLYRPGPNPMTIRITGRGRRSCLVTIANAGRDVQGPKQLELNVGGV